MKTLGVASGDWVSSVRAHDGVGGWGGSGWARVGQYIDRLDNFKVVYGTLLWNVDHFDILSADASVTFTPEVVLMQRLMHKGIADNIRIAQAEGQKIINDVDDWYWGLDTSNAAFNANHPKLNERENINFYKSIIARSDLVTVSTPYLADRLAGMVGKVNIEVVYNTVDLSRFTPRVHSDDGPPVVGWVGSTGHRSRDIETMRGILPPLVKSGQVRLHHSGNYIGYPSFASQLGVEDQDVSTLPLTDQAGYPDLMVMDIGIVPLSDIPFNRAKSYIKGLEYAAAGVPFIAKHIDSYIQLNGIGAGRLAKRPLDWVKHIKALSNADVRNEEAKRNLEAIQGCDIRHGIARITDVINHL